MRRVMPLYWVLAALLALLFILLFAAAATAYEPGDRVVLITEDNGIRIGNTIVDQPPITATKPHQAELDLHD